MEVITAILSVLLAILKIIGIIILAVLGLLLLLVCVILFLPVRYKASGSVGMEKQTVRANISWLLHLMSIRVFFEDGKTKYYARICGLKLINSEKPKKTRRFRKKNKKDNRTAPEEEIIQSNYGDTAVPESNKQDNEESEANHYCANDIEENHNDANDIEGNHNDVNDTEKEDKNASHKKKRTFSEKIANIKCQILQICDNIKNINETKNAFIDFLSTEESKKCISELKCRLLKILLHILPTRFRGNIRFGFTDPETTGKTYGFICIFLAKYGNTLSITPQFNDVEKTFVEGDFKFKGRIRSFVLIVQAIKIYKNKRLKEFLTFAKGKGKKNGSK